MKNKLLKKTFLFVIFTPFILFSLLVGFVFFYPASSTLNQVLPVGVVFGAGITITGVPSPALKFRLDKSIELYHAGWIKKIFISGRRAEIIVMMLYLTRNGILKKNLYLDYSGDNTAMTVSHVRQWLDKNGGGGAAMISQRYHLPRIQLLSWKCGIEDISVESSDYQKISWQENLKFILRESLAIISVFFNPVCSV